ncbi:antA/AntB antirepressor family protein [Testudinibacter sp. P27/CKL/0425]
MNVLTSAQAKALTPVKAPAEAVIFANQLPIQESYFQGVTTHSINARDLHRFLESKRQFANWIKSKIDRYGFKQGEDFAIVESFCKPEMTSKKSTGENLSLTNLLSSKNKQSTKARPQTQIDYHLSLNMAKELAMLERNQQGKLARKYFIDCETELNRVAPQRAEALRLDWLARREAAKAHFSPLTDALKASLIRSGRDPQKRYHYSNESAMVLSVVLGKSDKQYRKERGIVGNIRPTLNVEQLEKLAYLEQADAMLLNANIDDFHERKQKLIIACSNHFCRC